MFGAPLQISTGFASWQRYCTASSSGRQPNFAALNRGRHLCSAGRPSGWALAHILVGYFLGRFELASFHLFSFSIHSRSVHPPLDRPYSLYPQTPSHHILLGYPMHLISCTSISVQHLIQSVSSLQFACPIHLTLIFISHEIDTPSKPSYPHTTTTTASL